MAARAEALVARASKGAHAATVVDLRGHRSACGRTNRQTQRQPTARQRRRALDLELRDKHIADSIPIAHHRLRGRFSPTGSFAYRTRGAAAPLATTCAPRPPGKRLSALCKALHSDPNLPVRLLRSCPTIGPTSFRFLVSEAAVRGHQDPAINRRRRQAALLPVAALSG